MNFSERQTVEYQEVVVADVTPLNIQYGFVMSVVVLVVAIMRASWPHKGTE